MRRIVLVASWDDECITCSVLSFDRVRDFGFPQFIKSFFGTFPTEKPYNLFKMFVSLDEALKYKKLLERSFKNEKNSHP